MIDLAFVVLGVALLAIGGELLIRAALAVARRFGVSPLLSGLVIVGFGTSVPELAVSVDAALSNQPEIAIGNVVGSNIGNILLILGICALISPLKVRPLALRRDAVTVVAASMLFAVLVAKEHLTRIDALLLLISFFAYAVWAYRSERAHATPSAEVHIAEASELDHVPRSATITSLGLVGSLAFLIVGSNMLVKGAVGVAHSMGIPEAVIGMTIVAVGTSTPELSISVIAAIRRHADVAVGNVLGSNIFNLLGILGISALLQPLPVHARIVDVDQWVMLGAALALLLFLYTGRRLSRPEGVLLLAAYAIYVILAFTLTGSAYET